MITMIGRLHRRSQRGGRHRGRQRGMQRGVEGRERRQRRDGRVQHIRTNRLEWAARVGRVEEQRGLQRSTRLTQPVCATAAHVLGHEQRGAAEREGGDDDHNRRLLERRRGHL